MTEVKKESLVSVKKPPVHGMKWNRLGASKDPEFKTKYLLCKRGKDGQPPYYTLGNLRSKTEAETGLVYLFHDESVGEASNDFTYFAEIKPPVD